MASLSLTPNVHVAPPSKIVTTDGNPKVAVKRGLLRRYVTAYMQVVRRPLDEDKKADAQQMSL